MELLRLKSSPMTPHKPSGSPPPWVSTLHHSRAFLSGSLTRIRRGIQLVRHTKIIPLDLHGKISMNGELLARVGDEAKARELSDGLKLQTRDIWNEPREKSKMTYALPMKLKAGKTQRSVQCPVIICDGTLAGEAALQLGTWRMSMDLST
jgi:hypothetical protein